MPQGCRIAGVTGVAGIPGIPVAARAQATRQAASTASSGRRAPAVLPDGGRGGCGGRAAGYLGFACLWFGRLRGYVVSTYCTYVRLLLLCL